MMSFYMTEGQVLPKWLVYYDIVSQYFEDVFTPSYRTLKNLVTNQFSKCSVFY